MNAQVLLQAIKADEAFHISFLQRFVQAPSPNPPGDTREAVQVIVDYLRANGIEPEIIAPQEHMPNVVSDFECGDPSGPRLAIVSLLETS
jgi:succinyl-diaminopimelate desuccinylase